MACCAGGGNFALKLQTLEESSPLGVYLSFDELDKLARSCTISPIKQDQPLAESPFYIVLKGKVLVSTKTGKVLVSKVAGTFFTRCGSLAQTTVRHVRVFSVRPAASGHACRERITMGDLVRVSLAKYCMPRGHMPCPPDAMCTHAAL